MLCRYLVLICAGSFFGALQAQNLQDGPIALTATEVSQLRAVLAQPVPDGGLFNDLQAHFAAKEAAAIRLSDAAARVAVTRLAVEKLPNSAQFRNNLGVALDLLGKYDEAIQAWIDALRSDPGFVLAMTNIAETLIRTGRPDEATEWLTRAKATALQSTDRSAAGQSNQQRLLASTLRYQSQIEYAHGHLDKANELSAESIPFANRSVELAQNIALLPRTNRLESTINTYNSRIDILKYSGRFNEAEAVASELVKLSRTQPVPARLLPGFYVSLADLESARRDFRQAEAYARKAVDVWTSLGYPPDHANQIEATGALLQTLVYNNKFDDALSLLRNLDEMAGSNAELKESTRFSYARGLLYLKQKDFKSAIAPLRNHLAASERQYGRTNYHSAQAAGLLGFALWGNADSVSRKEAAPLLERAVHDYMAHENAEFTLDIYERNLQREWIFSAYLDAISQTDGQLAADALAAADWVRSSTVQEALTDAATRAAAATPAMADFIREDTDARNEARALSSFLSDAKFMSRVLPEVEKKMRARIVELNGQRAALQKAIKTQFPAYAQLVRPEPIVLAEIAKQLKPTQALVLLLPTESAVYVWSLTDSGLPRFHRAELGLKRVTELVKRMRQTLDFGAMQAKLDKFDAAAASDLYQSLLKPIEKNFSDKEDLIISAGGPLAQIPFSLLLTEPDTGGSESQWLIKRHAVTHVPSISSWLALQRFARSKPADEAMLGWGDPLFDPAAPRIAGGGATRNVALRRASRFVDPEREVPRAIDYSQIPPLPETRDELLSIARAVHANPASDLKLGDQATRESVLAASKSSLMGRKRVIAFATHGLMAGDFPGLNEPALALAASASGKPDPMASLLTLQDVMGLKLNADWVLLSACNTAAADGKAEEALSGLARGFFYAGSRSVLVTHWAVESESAKQLSTATFEHYAANPQAPKSESLRQAILKVMRQPEFAHPAFWAPYALVGDGNR